MNSLLNSSLILSKKLLLIEVLWLSFTTFVKISFAFGLCIDFDKFNDKFDEEAVLFKFTGETVVELYEEE